MSRPALRTFDRSFADEWIGFRILKRVTIVAAIVHFSLAAVAGFRAFVQVYSVGLDVPAVISPGTAFTGRVITSGRVFNDARVELIQGEKSETIATAFITNNRTAFYNAIPRRTEIAATIPADILTRFQRGSAKLRITGFGTAQFTRVPPPKSKDVVVELR